MVRGLNFIDSAQMPMNYHDLFTRTHVKYLDPSTDIRAVPDWVTRFYVPDGHMSVAGDQFLATYIYKRVFEGRTQ